MQLEKLHSPHALVEEFTSIWQVLWDYCTSPVDPSCAERVFWDIFMMLLLLYVTIVLPFRIAFDADAQFGMCIDQSIVQTAWSGLSVHSLRSLRAQSMAFECAYSRYGTERLSEKTTCTLTLGTTLYWLEIGIDIMFAVDIIVNFRTSFIQDGVMVTDHRRIAKQYMRTWLFVDVISVFPFDLLTGGNGLISNFLKVSNCERFLL
jgi:hypothetical protein